MIGVSDPYKLDRSEGAVAIQDEDLGK